MTTYYTQALLCDIMYVILECCKANKSPVLLQLIVVSN